ncbi:MAG: malate dehydrogenase [Candidatus Omnitrophica bacterium]|nr:malate dehydrogenase [Candidatus Omnitrophota bacterium]
MANTIKKISIIGAGNVGATLALRIAETAIADVVLLDIAEGICVGKATDLTDAAPLSGNNCKIFGTKDYTAAADSDIVVITAGLPRTPGMNREELFLKNSAIVRDAAEKIKAVSPEAIIIVVTNPLDAMTWLVLKATGFPKNRVMGMAGVLDASRFIALAAEAAGVRYRDVETFVIGSHGDTMVPVLSHTKIKGRPIEAVLAPQKIEEIVSRTKNRGAEIVGFLKTGSAYYAPSASVFSMIKAITGNTNEVLCVSCFLEGEYGLNDICIGVPAKIGRTGISKIVELSLNDEEKQAFERSAKQIRETIGKI